LRGALGRLGSAAGKVGGKLGGVAGRLADSKAVGWGVDKVRSVVMNDQIIKGWQDVYKGIKTLEPGTRTTTTTTVRVIRSPGALGNGAGTAGKAAGTAGKAAGTAGKAARTAGRAAKASGAANAGKAANAAKHTAGGAKSAASGAARQGVVLREGTKVAGRVTKIKVPGGFREITRIDATKVEAISKSAKAAKGAAGAAKGAKGVAEAAKTTREAGLKVIRGTKFRLANSGVRQGVEGAKVASKLSGAPGGGSGAAKALSAAKGAGAAAKGAKGAKTAGTTAKNARGLARTAKGAKNLRSAGTGAARAAKGARNAGYTRVTRTTVTSAAKKGFKKPFGVQAIKQGFKGIFQGAMKAAKVSGLVNFAISLVSNTYGVMTGQIGLPEAMGSLVRDTAAGFVAGGAAAVFSGGVLAVVGALGLTAGLPCFLIGLGASLLGYMFFNAIFNAVIGDRLAGFVSGLMGG
jgi:hypothetical protein